MSVSARFFPGLLIACVTLPVAFGLLGIILPAFGYMPSIGQDDFSLAPWRDLFQTPGLVRSGLLGLFTGLAATALSISVVAVFLAAFHGSGFFLACRRLLAPLLSVPHAAAALGLAFLIAPSGWIMRILSPGVTGFERPPDVLVVHDELGLAMVAGLVAKEVPFLFLMAVAALPQIRFRADLHVADSLGYGRVAGWLFVVFPRVYLQIRLAVFAVLAYSASVVDVAYILGPTTPAPLSVRLVEWMNDPDLSMRLRASAGALLQLAITGLAALLWLGLERVVAGIGRVCLERGCRLQRDAPVRVFSAIVTLTSMVMVFAGLAALVLWSFADKWWFPDALPAGLTLKVWMREASGLVETINTTLAIGLPALAAALVLVLVALEGRERAGETGTPSRLFLAGLYAPLLVPQVVFLFGLQVGFLRLGLDASLVALVLVHMVFVVPYVYLSFSEPWQAFDGRYALVAGTLGHGPDAIFWRIRLPMLLRAILTAAAVGFAVSVGLYLPTLLIGGGRFATVTTEAVALSSGGNRRIIGAYALIQMALPFAGFLLAALVTRFVQRGRRGLEVGL